MSGIRQSLRNFKTAVWVNVQVWVHRSVEYQQNRGNKTNGKWTTQRDFSIPDTELARNVHEAGESPIYGRKDCPAKEAEFQKCFVKGQLCATQRKLSEDWQKKRMSYWVSTQWSIPERAKLKGTASVNSLELQDLWHTKIWVNHRKVNLRVDTGVDVTVVPRRYFTKNSLLIQKTNKKHPGKTKIDVVGQFQVTLTLDNRTNWNEADFVRSRQSSKATSRQTSDRGSPSAWKSEHTTISRQLWPKQCQEWVSKVVQRSWKGESK